MISNSNNLALRGEDSSPSSSTESDGHEFYLYRINREAQEDAERGGGDNHDA